MKLVHRKRKEEMKEFMAELRSRADEGYSTRQLMDSLIPDIGREMKVSASEVTAALQSHEVIQFLPVAAIPLFFWATPIQGTLSSAGQQKKPSI